MSILTTGPDRINRKRGVIRAHGQRGTVMLAAMVDTVEWVSLAEVAAKAGVDPRKLRDVTELQPHIAQVTERKWVIDRAAWNRYLDGRRIAVTGEAKP